MKVFIVLGRILFGGIFVAGAPGLFKNAAIQMAAGHGLRMAESLVPLAGIIALLGGLSVILGCKARWGACLLILFLVPVTVVMHNFWAVTDPAAAQVEQINFLKNLALIGGACVVAYFGAGPVSFDECAANRIARRKSGEPMMAHVH